MLSQTRQKTIESIQNRSAFEFANTDVSPREFLV